MDPNQNPQNAPVNEPQPQQPAPQPVQQAPAQQPVAPVTETQPPVQQPQAPAQPAPQAPAELAPQQPAAPIVEEENYDEDPIPTFNLPRNPQPQQPVQPQPQPGVAPQQTPAQPGLPQVPPLDPSQFADQYGTVDMAKFSAALADRDARLVQQVTQNLGNSVTQQVLQQAAQVSANQIMESRKEERYWSAAEKKYPELKDNKELRDLVHKQRLSVIAGGGNDTPLKAADRLFKYIGQARQQGQNEANETTTIQAAAHLESADNTQSSSAAASQQISRSIGSKNPKEARQARQALLKQWISEGKISTQ